jgi:tRNA(Ile)-lysidine synthase TilS/MesJ
MTASASPAIPKTRQTAADRAARRVRILAHVEEGWSHDRIALAEGLTRERVRQIIVEILEEREVDPSREHAILQAARLDGALRLAAERIAEGELRAIDPLLRVLDRLDKYQHVAAAFGTEKEKAAREHSFKERLADLVDRARKQRAREAAAAAAAGGQRAGQGGGASAAMDA